MKAFVRKLNGRYYLIGGTPESFSNSSQVLGEYITRRQAIRLGKQQGYDIVINTKTKEEEKTQKNEESEVSNMDNALKIKLSNYQDYHSGNSGGEWLKLPATVDELDSVLLKLGVLGGEHGMDYFIADFESSFPAFENLSIEFVRRISIDELNYIAGNLENASKKQIATVNNLVSGFDEYATAAHVAEATKDDEVWDTFTEIPEDYLIEQRSMDRNRIVQLAGQLQMYDAAPTPRTNLQTPKADTPISKKTTDPYTKVKETVKELEQGIKGVFESDKYKNYLETLSKFHNYSYNNCLLIAMQRPNASYVAGFNFWRDNMKRHVKKGEKGIKILAPSPYMSKREVERTAPDGRTIFDKSGKPVMDTVEVKVPGFKVVHVFDVEQTYGEPMPTLGVNELQGSIPKFKEIFPVLQRISPVPITFEDMKGEAKGYYDINEKKIVVRKGMSDLQNLKTTLHEIAHSRIHGVESEKTDGIKADSRQREVEAEGIAYTVSKHYGFDTSDYSFGYIAGWSSGKELSELKASLGTIRKEAHNIITELDKHFQDLKIEAEHKVEPEKDRQNTPSKKDGQNTPGKPEPKAAQKQQSVAKRTAKSPAPKKATEKPSIAEKLEASKRKAATRARQTAAKSKTADLEVS